MFYRKPTQSCSFKQIEFISMLRNQIGNEEFLRIKKKLRLKRETKDLSRISCSRLIQELINLQRKKRGITEIEESSDDDTCLSDKNITIHQALDNFLTNLHGKR